MAPLKFLPFLFASLFCFVSSKDPTHFNPHYNSNAGIRAAYFPSYSSFSPSSIDTSLFTHIYYAFLLPNPTTYELTITKNDQQKLQELTNTLHTLKPSMKTLLSIGGGGSDSLVFSKMASKMSTRKVFIKSTIDVARKYGFDGVDLDWEFPENDLDMYNLGLLFQEWRKEFVHEAKLSKKHVLLLTAAVYYANNISLLGDSPRAYPGGMIAKYVDWVSPMCFDYHGSWAKFTGIHSALYDPKSDISTDYGINSWIVQAGVPPTKLVMGLPMYGRTWTLKDPTINGLGAPATGSGPGEDGAMIYSKIMDFNTQKNATIKFDPQSVAYYSYSGNAWIGYDDVHSIWAKVKFAKSKGLAGYFFWALGQDKNWALSTSASNSWST
ncbi:hypothetical protein Leryth_008538 [Lithospermum erythrorhizon]|nr:hypothetical protein Leryth_008538 [Lithospermum erythrorhizon]